MTAAEYRKAYNNARRQLVIIAKKAQKELLKLYIEAGDIVADKIRDATARELSQYTTSGLRSIDDQIKNSANQISAQIEDRLPIVINQSYRNYAAAESLYIYDAAKNAGSELITLSGMSNVATAVNDNLAREVFNLQFQDGLRYSNRIWDEFKPNGLPGGINGDFQYRIKNVINLGTIQGRDPIKIAEDLNVYLRDGKVQMLKRYGKLERGTSAFKNRISNKVDWRAVRLVRSVQNSGMQLASIKSAQINPAHSGFYNWKKTPGNPIDPDGSRNASGQRCIDLEDGNPYTAQTVPDYQHSNCSCFVSPILRPRQEFNKDLKAWVNGDYNYVAQWYNTSYRPVN